MQATQNHGGLLGDLENLFAFWHETIPLTVHCIFSEIIAIIQLLQMLLGQYIILESALG